MRALVEAVAESIESEISESSEWTIEQHDRMWRNPKKGKVLNIYPERRFPGQARWTGGTVDIVEISLEYGEPASSKQTRLQRDEDASWSADEVVDSLREWALAHEAGFSPAHKLDWAGTDYSPRVRPEMFVRYARCVIAFEVQVSYG